MQKDKGRYLETLPAQVKNIIKLALKPKVEKIENLLPSICIEQKTHSVNPRSTVGTLTEIYDYIRILYAHMGEAFCPETNEKITQISTEYVQKQILKLTGEKIFILAPISLLKKESFSEFVQRLSSEGFLRIRLNGKYYEIDEEIPYDERIFNEIFLVIDRFIIKKEIEKRLLEAIILAGKIGNNKLMAASEKKDHFYNLSFTCTKTNKSYPEITVNTFSFNSQAGMCLTCQGLGYIWGINFYNDPEILQKTPMRILKALLKKKARYVKDEIEEKIKELSIEPNISLLKQPKEKQKLFFEGEENTNSHPLKYLGIKKGLERLAKASKKHIKENLLSYMEEKRCPDCKGVRLNPYARNVKIKNMSIEKLCSLPIEKVKDFLNKLNVEDFLKETLIQIKKSY